jgi:predicted O-methyltransferase YrrM
MNYDPTDCTGDEGLLVAEQEFDKRFSGNPVVTKLKMKSSDAVSQFEDGTIDFIYIDGNHQYDFVKKDLELYVPKIKSGGIISGHDYGGPTTPGVTRAVDEFFGKSPVSRYGDYSWVHIKE